MIFREKARPPAVLRGLTTLARMGLGTMLTFASAVAQKPEQRFVVLEFLDPAATHESNFTAWWPGHLNQMRNVPGFVSLMPFQRASTPLKRPSAVPLPNHMYVLILNGRDQAEVESEVKAGFRAITPAVDAASARIFLYRQTGTWNSAAPATIGDFYRQLVFGNSMPGREAAFNDWYDNTHARDLVTVPGVVSVTRFVFAGTLLGPADVPPKYLSMMDFRTSSVERFSVQLDEVGAHFANTDAFDGAHAWRHLYQQVVPTP